MVNRKHALDSLQNFALRADLHVKLRILALCSFGLTLVTLLADGLGFLPSTRLIIISNIMLVLLSGAAAVYPNYYWFFVLFCFNAGLVNIYVGGNLLGFLFYMFGVAVLFKAGFFRTKGRHKAAALCVLFCSVLAAQFFSMGAVAFNLTLLHLAVAALWAGGLFFMFHDNLKKYYTKKEIIYIDELGLTQRQCQCLAHVLRGKTYKDIGNILHLSESVIKKEMSEVFKQLHIESQADFIKLCEKYDFAESDAMRYAGHNRAE